MSTYRCHSCGREYPDHKSKCIWCGAPKNGTNDDIGETEPFDDPQNNDDSDDGKTTIYKPVEGMAVTPVVGWLVCTEGLDKGKDFRLHVDNNFAGRGSKYDINLHDQKVSRKRHFSVAYDREGDDYFITMGEGAGIVKLNNKPLGGGLTYLNKGDKIRVGDTTLVFIPLETAYVQWEW